MSDRVSVVIPAFQAAGTIERALKSVLGQTAPPREVLVVDDGSTDDTVDRARSLGDPRIRVIRLPTNSGAAAARNAGCAEAVGEWIAFLDADDAWHPEKLARQLAVIDAPDVVLVGCDCLLHQPSGQSTRFYDAVPPADGLDAWRVLLSRNFLPTPTVLVRRASLVTVGGFDPSLVVGEDLDLWIRVAEQGRVLIVREPLASVYWRADSVLRRNPRGEFLDVLPMIERHLRRLRDRIGPGEARRVRARVSFDFAYRALGGDMEEHAFPLFVRSAVLGHRPVRSVYFAARTLAPMLLKRALSSRGPA